MRKFSDSVIDIIVENIISGDNRHSLNRIKELDGEAKLYSALFVGIYLDMEDEQDLFDEIVKLVDSSEINNEIVEILKNLMYIFYFSNTNTPYTDKDKAITIMNFCTTKIEELSGDPLDLEIIKGLLYFTSAHLEVHTSNNLNNGINVIQKAISHFDECSAINVKLEPLAKITHVYLGYFQTGKGNIELALEAYQQAMDIISNRENLQEEVEDKLEGILKLYSMVGAIDKISQVLTMMSKVSKGDSLKEAQVFEYLGELAILTDNAKDGRNLIAKGFKIYEDEGLVDESHHSLLNIFLTHYNDYLSSWAEATWSQMITIRERMDGSSNYKNLCDTLILKIGTAKERAIAKENLENLWNDGFMKEVILPHLLELYVDDLRFTSNADSINRLSELVLSTTKMEITKEISSVYKFLYRQLLLIQLILLIKNDDIMARDFLVGLRNRLASFNLNHLSQLVEIEKRKLDTYDMKDTTIQHRLRELDLNNYFLNAFNPKFQPSFV